MRVAVARLDAAGRPTCGCGAWCVVVRIPLPRESRCVSGREGPRAWARPVAPADQLEDITPKTCVSTSRDGDGACGLVTLVGVALRWAPVAPVSDGPYCGTPMYQNMEARVVMARVARFGCLLCVVIVALLGPVGVGRAAVLPDGRAYELVSPPSKNGGSVVADTQRTRAAADGGAVGFVALTAFADPLGTGIGTDYVALRDPQGTAGAGNGWATHPVDPLQSATTYDGILAILEPLYVGEFTRDLGDGVFFAQSPVTSDPYTAQVPNLYMRSDLRTAGAGAYSLISGCPVCAGNGRALPALAVVQSGVSASKLRPFWAGMSADGQHVAFESRQPLTADAPVLISVVKLYEWDQGTVRLVGRVPPTGATECDDLTQAPACVPSGASIAGQGAGAHSGLITLVAHVMSDGTDGHIRVFFTRPTGSDGTTLD